ncbi:MAG TPA: shikimate dehydrogenase [Gammaproteobacteria bacterium]|nr:shikimate dehydrogenase [Gammaproteobacteria bacterium]
MPSDNRVDRYAVVGNPVAHSLSPRIHAEFARATGESLEYRAIEIASDAFAAGIADLQQQGFRGLNVTVPFKGEAWELCSSLTPRARTAGAVNTLCLQADGTIHGDNTDGIGLVRDLVDNLKIDIEQRKILVLGAGGAVRGVLEPLLALSPTRITLANRNIDRARGLARDFRSFGKIEVVAYNQLKPEGYHLIINATAAGLSNQIPPIPAAVLDRASVCYDMMYNLSAKTSFVEWSLAHGVAHSHDGLGMLVEQAAEAFYLWRGLRPDTSQLLSMLRSS